MEKVNNSVQEEKRQLTSIWDEYCGKYVFVQLAAEYVAVANPGLFVSVETQQGPQLLRTPLLQGIWNVKKDERGNTRVLLTISDPNPEEDAVIRVDLDPKYIFSVSVPQKQEIDQEPLIKL